MTPISKYPNTSAIRLAIKESTVLGRFYRSEAARLLQKSRKARAKSHWKDVPAGKSAALTKAADTLLKRVFDMRWHADYEAPAQRNRLAALAICRGKQLPGNPALLSAEKVVENLVKAGFPEAEAKTAFENAKKGIVRAPLAQAA
jgi:hypothetical protein